MLLQTPFVRFICNAGLSCFVLLALLPAAQAELSDELDCVIYPSLVADLGSSAIGTLSEISVDRGDAVTKGEKIAALESGAELAALQLAKIRAASTAEIDLQNTSIAFAERRQLRAQGLLEPKLISESNIDEYATETRLGHIQLQRANENADIARLELRQAEELLSRRTIRSPFDGVVLEKYKTVGEMVEDKPVVRVAKLNPLHVEVIVPASQITQLETGTQAQVRIADSEGTAWTATVNRIDLVADVASDTYGVRLELPNPDFSVPAGRRCLVRFLASKAPIELSADIHPDAPATTSIASITTKHMQAPELGAAIKQPVAGLKRTNSLPNQDTDAHGSNCQWAGPFNELDIAKEKQNSFIKIGFDTKLVEHSSRQERGSVVVSTLQSSRREAEKLLNQLHNSGYLKAYLPKGSTERQIALGAFEDTEKAEQLRRSLSRRGIDVEVHPWNQLKTHYYLAVNYKAIGSSSETTVRVPLLKNAIPLRNSDGTFRQASCDEFLKQ